MRAYKRYILVSIVLAISLASCKSTSPRLDGVIDRQQTITLNGFSLVTPDEYGWQCMSGSTNGESIGLAKTGSNPDETYVFQVWTKQLPQIWERVDDHVFQTISVASLQNGWDKNRFIEVDLNYGLVDTKHGKCMRFLSIHQDLQAHKKTSNTEPMLLEAMGIICRKPQKETDLVNVVYSHRYYPGHRDYTLIDKAQAQFDGIDFNITHQIKSRGACQ